MFDTDADGMLPLSNKEYGSLKMVMASLDSLVQETDRLEKRAKLAGNGTWRDLKLLKTVTERVYRNLMGTVPLRKRQIVKEEVYRSYVSVNVKPKVNLPEHEETQYTVVPIDSLEWLINRVLKFECFCCDKEGKDQKKCPFRENLEKMYAFDLNDIRQGECPFATIESLNL